MTTKTEAALKQALALSDQERVEIAGELLQSIEPPEDAEVDRAWREEIARRVAELDAGTAQTIPWEDASRRLWARFGETRPR